MKLFHTKSNDDTRSLLTTFSPYLIFETFYFVPILAVGLFDTKTLTDEREFVIL